MTTSRPTADQARTAFRTAEAAVSAEIAATGRPLYGWLTRPAWAQWHHPAACPRTWSAVHRAIAEMRASASGRMAQAYGTGLRGDDARAVADAEALRSMAAIR